MQSILVWSTVQGLVQESNTHTQGRCVSLGGVRTCFTAMPCCVLVVPFCSAACAPTSYTRTVHFQGPSAAKRGSKQLRVAVSSFLCVNEQGPLPWLHRWPELLTCTHRTISFQQGVGVATLEVFRRLFMMSMLCCVAPAPSARVGVTHPLLLTGTNPIPYAAKRRE